MSNQIDLTLLPVPEVVEQLDFETILASRKAELVGLYPVAEQAAVTAALTLESEPLNKLLQASAYRELVLRQRCNDASLAVMVPYAQRTDLDNLAAGFGLARLVVSPGNSEAVPPVAAIYEPDDELRQRIPASFEGMSVAGPSGAYEAHARSADGRIADVSVESPEPCDIVIAVLARTGDGTAPQDLLDVVKTALSDEDVRPLGDRLDVRSAGIVNYAISAVPWLYKGPESELVLAAAHARLATYIATQRKLGKSIRRSAIASALHVEGVEHVDVLLPAADIVLSKLQAGFCTGVTVTAAVLDD